MSGVYGIYRYDGAAVDPGWLERMKTAMAFYGPHGGDCKIDGPVGLGHLLLEVNPEDAFEKQPVRGERGLVVSAARLDNRAELLAAFNVSSSEAAQTSDGHLVSLAYDRWVDGVCPHLQGDWSLAAWDPRERRLLLAMNALGNSSLYYYEGKGFLAFASNLKALLALPGVVKEPDRLRLAEVLVSWQPDGELTAYKGFRRLLWAQAMTVSADGSKRIWRHWSPEGRELLNYRRDDDYVEAFLEHYTRAVQSCLRTQKPISAELSAGRDSGSVVALAAPMLAAIDRDLTAYTSVPVYAPDGAQKYRLGNEWELAHATATMAGANVKHLPIDARDSGVIHGIESFLDYHEGPGHAASNCYWMQAILQAVANNGSKALLTGRMGNATVSWIGNGSPVLALLQGDPGTAWRLLRRGEPSPWLTLKRQILKPIIIPVWFDIRHRMSSPSKIARAYSALNLNMAKELDMDRRMVEAGHDATFTFSPLADRHSMFFGPTASIGASITTESASNFSLCSLDPTMNIPLTEFILRVPDDQFWRGEYASWLFGRAFRDRMPDSILNRPQIGLQAADVGHRILHELPAVRDCLDSLGSIPEAREMLDLPLMQTCLDDLVAKVDPKTTARAGMILLRGLGVGLFLRRIA